MIEKLFQSTFFLVLSFKGYLMRRLLKSVLSISLFTAVFCALYEFRILNFYDDVALPSVMGAAMGMLLIFRNNTAYDRWWEARHAWGSVTNTSRSLAMTAMQMMPERKDMLALTVAFCYALKEHLRDGVKVSELSFLKEEYRNEIMHAVHRPNAVAMIMMRLVRRGKTQGQIGEREQVRLMALIDELVNQLGRCERIKNTPIPQAHSYLLKFFLFIYAATLPFSFVGSMHWWSILAVASIYFVMMSLVYIAEEIEDPFGREPNDLPTDDIVKNIHRNINEIYLSMVPGDADTPLLESSPSNS